MNPTKWRISKACQECRVKKIKCNGQTPCESCRIRGLECVYREKARNRMRKSKPRMAAYETIMSQEPKESTSLEPSETGSPAAPTPNPDRGGSVPPDSNVGGSERSINNTSVAATHRAPSCLIQLYYGPSSNFALLNSIYHQIEGTRPKSPPRDGVEEVGLGLDLFSHRRLFFGDLADNQRPSAIAEDYSAILLDPVMARRLLDRYLLTYWHGLPIDKNIYRNRLESLFQPPGIFDFDSSETIIIMLAMALGASMLGEETVAEFLFHKAKQGAAKLDEVVNMQVVQIHLMMISRPP